MREKRQRILDNPIAYRQEQINKKLPEDFDELPENEQNEIIEELENVVANVDPAALRQEIQQLDGLIDWARLGTASSREKLAGTRPDGPR